jgi:hypothetical protein
MNENLLHSVFFIILVLESSREVVGMLEKYGFLYFIIFLDNSFTFIV